MVEMEGLSRPAHPNRSSITYSSSATSPNTSLKRRVIAERACVDNADQRLRSCLGGIGLGQTLTEERGQSQTKHVHLKG